MLQAAPGYFTSVKSNIMNKDATGKDLGTKITRLSDPEDNMRMILALGAALCAGFVSTPAQAWETIDDAAGATRENVNSVTSDGAGNIFTAGTMVDATGRYHAVIMKSSDSGAT